MGAAIPVSLVNLSISMVHWLAAPWGRNRPKRAGGAAQVRGRKGLAPGPGLHPNPDPNRDQTVSAISSRTSVR
ncbi:hypothetical protein GCM10011452_18400 [Gemmobacter lanyuensis]|uniref:Uncharacterized protein n=1 Tax=Gemmobacter lanyuensis TaxID=1054497 RepID=A0A918MK91_9RHOB|nr:hypothetical protein GCM10011452_18400 [Gemmobacter lanyuensis]